MDEGVKLNREPGSQSWGLFSTWICVVLGASPLWPQCLHFPVKYKYQCPFLLEAVFPSNSNIELKIFVPMWKWKHRKSHTYRIMGVSLPVCVCCRLQETVTNNWTCRVLIQPRDELHTPRLTSLDPNYPRVERGMLAQISISQPWWHIRIIWEDILKCWCPHPPRTHHGTINPNSWV